MQTLKNKLKSGRGASLTFALLMFLVCAVVGSAVLTAGTAASGRMSRIAEMDQRYYSVNSAARLLIDMMEHEKVRVEKTETGDPAAVSYKYFKVGATGSEEVDVSQGFTSIAMEAAYRISHNVDEDMTKSINYLIVPDFGENNDSYKVKVTETIVPDGSMLFKLQNENTAAGSYKINVRFSADKKEKYEFIAADNKKVITTELSWKLSDIQPVWQGPQVSPVPTGGQTP